MTNEELEEVICGLHRRIALTTAGTPLQDDLIKAVGALRIAVNRIAELEAQMPREGRWIQMNGHKYCNVCGHKDSPILTNYCPNCGARMKGEHDGES